jgi:polypeptide N-acetylgalactosaminyltransferase
VSNVGDLSDYQRLKDKLACRDLGWFLKRFSFIYRDAGLIPDSIFRLEASGSDMCLQYTRAKGTSPDGRGTVNLARCSTSESQFFGLRNRKTARESAARECCNGIGAWDTDQCFSHLNGNNIQTTGCDVAGRNWQQVWALDDAGRLSLSGPGGGCLQADPIRWQLSKVKCTLQGLTVWKKRDETVPLEKQLYDQSIQDLVE